jgi:hypothetical protein
MPDPDRLVQTLVRAAQAFRATPGRRGRFVELVGAEDVLVAGDLHGNLENFRKILLKADLGRRTGRHLVLQEAIHGPLRYANGGDKSHQLVDLIAALKCQYPERVHYLLGNHELAQLTNRRIGKNESDLNELFRAGIAAAYAPREEVIYQAYCDLFRAAPLALRTTNRVFLSHSLPARTPLEDWQLSALERDPTPDADLLPGGPIYSLVWGRDASLETATAFLQKVDADRLITGHIPCERGFYAPNDRQIILDSIATPAGYCLFPANRPLEHFDIVGHVSTL